jgi:hypothetical protein
VSRHIEHTQYFAHFFNDALEGGKFGKHTVCDSSGLESWQLQPLAYQLLYPGDH